MAVKAALLRFSLAVMGRPHARSNSPVGTLQFCKRVFKASPRPGSCVSLWPSCCVRTKRVLRKGWGHFRVSSTENNPVSDLILYHMFFYYVTVFTICGYSIRWRMVLEHTVTHHHPKHPLGQMEMKLTYNIRITVVAPASWASVMYYSSETQGRQRART